MSQPSYWKVLTRRKTITNDPESDTKLDRVMTTYDLTALGVGATLGVGVYVLAGHVAKDQAGPSVVISFAIAAMASLLAGLCYAEFGARVPKAGSAYIYSYVCIGEFAAFVIGWNLILEYIIGSASVCRGVSLYMDTLVNNTIKTTFLEIAPIGWGFLATYFDFFAFGLACTFGIALSFGFQTSTVLNNCCTILNVGVVLFVIIAGSIKADIKNWEINPQTVNNSTTDNEFAGKLGDGGFFPFGFEGTLKGAATCFFGFVGFDCIATTGEEVKEPRRAIPRAILFSLLIIFLSYFGVSTVLTLMWPYYLQDVDAPLPYAFEEIGWPIAKWIVTIGGMLGLVASLFGALFPLPRIIYAMSQDGLLFRFLGKISPKFKAPVFGSVCAAILTGIFAGLFDLTQLVNMMSIGTLLAYTVVAISITILRFMDNTVEANQRPELNEKSTLTNNMRSKKNFNSIMMQFFNLRRLKRPTELSTELVCILIMIYCVCCIGISLTIKYLPNEILNTEPLPLTLLAILIGINLIIIIAISVQPREDENPYFRVPLVPLVPGISIFVNIYLMLQLDQYTWIRFGVWMAIGLIVYIACFCLYQRQTKITDNYSLFKSFLTTNNNLNGSEQYETNKQLSLPKFESHLNGIDIKYAENNAIDCNSSMSSLKSLSKNIINMNESLDAIVLVSDVSDIMTEMKLSNGKIFFVETDSIKKEPIESVNNNNNDLNNGTTMKTINDDDPKMVIAMLDNVLQDEEDETMFKHQKCSRKSSVDSEMLPSFVEMSISATVHNISAIEDNCFKEEEVEDDNSSGPTSICGKNNNNIDGDDDDDDDRSSIAAFNVSLVENQSTDLNDSLEADTIIQPDTIILADKKLSEKIDVEHKEPNQTIQLETSELKPEKQIIIPLETPTPKNEKLKPNVNVTIIPLKSPALSPILRRQSSSRSSSSSSSASNSANDHPNKLEKFKLKLTRLIAQPPPLRTIPKKTEEIELPKPAPQSISTPSSPLKLSKSEADIRKLVLQEIENFPQINNSPMQTNDNQNNSNNSNNNINNSNNSYNNNNNNNNIPEAPKFDPILYKTLGAKSSNPNKIRPKLDDLIGNNGTIAHDKLLPILPQPVDNDESQEQAFEPLEFKQKLAALLKRGPSYRIQTQLTPRPSNNTNIKLNKTDDNNNNNKEEDDDDSNRKNYLNVLKAIKSVNNSTTNVNDKSTKSNQSNTNNNNNNNNNINNNNPSNELEEVRKKLKPIVM